MNGVERLYRKVSEGPQPPEMVDFRVAVTMTWEGPILAFREEIRGFDIHRRLLDLEEQRALLEDVRACTASAPFVRPMTAWGKPMSVRMTSAGEFGWIIERGRYRYSSTHPETGAPWPAIPERFAELWRRLAPGNPMANSCLINWYGEGARMGLHQDRDEGRFEAPVISISLGDPCRFRMGGTDRKGETVSTILESGDVVVMGGAARLAFHGVDRILFGQGTLLPDGGRINLTLRHVTSETD